MADCWVLQYELWADKIRATLNFEWCSSEVGATVFSFHCLRLKGSHSAIGKGFECSWSQEPLRERGGRWKEKGGLGCEHTRDYCKRIRGRGVHKTSPLTFSCACLVLEADILWFLLLKFNVYGSRFPAFSPTSPIYIHLLDFSTKVTQKQNQAVLQQGKKKLKRNWAMFSEKINYITTTSFKK